MPASTPTPQAAPVRKGAWTAAQRRLLTAIQHPHQADPVDFLFDAASAARKLKGFGAVPKGLTVATETARLKKLDKWDRDSGKPTATLTHQENFWVPLVGLWLARNGWDFVFDLITDDVQRLGFSAHLGAWTTRGWFAIRRYLWAASAEDLAAARARHAPLFERLLAMDTQDERRDPFSRDLLAFVFDREGDWAERVLTEVVAGRRDTKHLHLLIAVSRDPALSLKAIAGYTRPLQFRELHDLVETLGSAALPLLRCFKPTRSDDRAYLRNVVALAEKLAKLGF